MLSNLDSLGTQTISKIAEVALASQMKQVDKLSVDVKIEPENLAKGMVNALAIEGRGLVTQSSLRVEKISLIIKEIAVAPFKALMGNIQLTKPASGHAVLMIEPKDFAEALETLLAQDHEKDLQVRSLECEFSSPDLIKLQAQVLDKRTSDSETLELLLKTVFDPNRQAVILEDVDYVRNEVLGGTVGARIEKQLLDILNFQFLVFEGLSFQVNGLEILNNALELSAIAEITSFPKAA
ncbi:MAG: DUF2993 domain-containing protein [Limnothrix sp.]